VAVGSWPIAATSRVSLRLFNWTTACVWGDQQRYVRESTSRSHSIRWIGRP